MIKYQKPSKWIIYDQQSLFAELADAKASVMSLKAVPYQRRWVEALQALQLKLEVAGTSKIEGADFAGNELDQALKESPEQLLTRSQKQAHSAMQAYKYIASLPSDKPVTEELILEIHRLIITGADDDHCAPGKLRGKDQNVTFGVPTHRGCEGGEECSGAFSDLVSALQHEYQAHDPLIQSLAFHYHFAAMHPFVDGNGRTARAMEALLLQRAGLRETLFIAMSNYYYDEKKDYLSSLSAVRASNYDLTAFIKFGLKGISLQSKRLLEMLNTHIKKELFRNLMHDLFTRLRTPRKRVIANRQLVILEKFLASDTIEFEEMVKATNTTYSPVANPRKALIRDLNSLLSLGAIMWKKENWTAGEPIILLANLDWPSQITESAFFSKVKNMPKSKTHSFLSPQ
jgi:Fic family protein